MSDICPICHDTINTSKATTPCGHIFHTVCLMQHCITSRTGLCPYCRNDNVQQLGIQTTEQPNNHIENIISQMREVEKEEKEFDDIIFMNRKHISNCGFTEQEKNDIKKSQPNKAKLFFGK